MEAEEGALEFTYVFNYFGKKKFKGYSICGAYIEMIIHAHSSQEGQADDEMVFEDEPVVTDKTSGNPREFAYEEIFNVSFDREKLLSIKENDEAYQAFKNFLGCTFSYQVTGYGLVISDNDKEISKEMAVRRKDFEAFLRADLDEFDISDNQPASALSVKTVICSHHLAAKRLEVGGFPVRQALGQEVIPCPPEILSCC